MGGWRKRAEHSQQMCERWVSTSGPPRLTSPGDTGWCPLLSSAPGIPPRVPLHQEAVKDDLGSRAAGTVDTFAKRGTPGESGPVEHGFPISLAECSSL